MPSDAVESICEQIASAFSDVQLEGGVSLHEAEVMDAYGTPEERLAAKKKDLDSRWQDVPAHDIETHTSTFSFVDTKGFRYYLPAYMIWALRNHLRSNSMAIDATIYALDLSTEPAARAWKLERFASLDPNQARAVREFLTHMARSAAAYCDGEIAEAALLHYWEKR